jgi:hypothetical protein
LVLALVGAPRRSVAQSYQGTPTPAITGTRTSSKAQRLSCRRPVRLLRRRRARTPRSSGTSEPAPGLSFGAAPAPIVSPNR